MRVYNWICNWRWINLSRRRRKKKIQKSQADNFSGLYRCWGSKKHEPTRLEVGRELYGNPLYIYYQSNNINIHPQYSGCKDTATCGCLRLFCRVQQTNNIAMECMSGRPPPRHGVCGLFNSGRSVCRLFSVTVSFENASGLVMSWFSLKSSKLICDKREWETRAWESFNCPVIVKALSRISSTRTWAFVPCCHLWRNILTNEVPFTELWHQRMWVNT